jgi:hypothetical protein
MEHQRRFAARKSRRCHVAQQGIGLCGIVRANGRVEREQSGTTAKPEPESATGVGKVDHGRTRWKRRHDLDGNTVRDPPAACQPCLEALNQRAACRRRRLE